MNEPAGPDNIHKKHLGLVMYEDISLQLGLSSSAATNDWIKAVIDVQRPRKNGSIYTLGQTGTVIEELQFLDALITEVSFPALDAASRAKAFMTVRIKPELVRVKQGGVLPPPPPGNKQKSWLASNFRFRLGQLPATRVAKVEAISVKQNMSTAENGGQREHTFEPTTVEYPNLKITLAAADTPAWRTWFEDFVIQGHNSDDKELAGSLTWLAPDLRTELGKLTLSHVGVFRLAPESAEAGGEKSRRVVAELYCEKISIAFTG